jgi:hypothetical protein
LTYLVRSYVKTGETLPFPDDMTDTPRFPIHFCVLERPFAPVA